MDDLGTTRLGTGVPQEQEGLSTGFRDQSGRHFSQHLGIHTEMGVSIRTIHVFVMHSWPDEGRLMELQAAGEGG